MFVLCPQHQGVEASPFTLQIYEKNPIYTNNNQIIFNKKESFFRVMIEVFSISVRYWKISVRYWEISVRYGLRAALGKERIFHIKARHLNAESRKCGKRTWGSFRVRKRDIISRSSFKLLLLPYYIYIYLLLYIPSLEYLNVHFPTFLLFYFLLIERKTFLLNICVKTILFHIIIKNSLYLCKP